MSQVALDVGFVPLLDALPLVIARELGFAAEVSFEDGVREFATAPLRG